MPFIMFARSNFNEKGNLKMIYDGNTVEKSWKIREMAHFGWHINEAAKDKWWNKFINNN